MIHTVDDANVLTNDSRVTVDGADINFTGFGTAPTAIATDGRPTVSSTSTSPRATVIGERPAGSADADKPRATVTADTPSATAQ